MTVTPTYHVFEMYKDHQGATALPVWTTAETYDLRRKHPRLERLGLPGQEGDDHRLLVQPRPQSGAADSRPSSGARDHRDPGRILTADTMNADNTFDAPETVTARSI